MPTDINTISAWAFLISTLVSALTGFFIVQTFLLQAKLAQEQSKITKLEVERSIMEKRPVFFAKRHIYTEDEGKDSENKYFRVDLTLLRNDIYNYTIEVIFLCKNTEKKYNFTNFATKLEKGLIEGSVVILAYSLPIYPGFFYISQPGQENKHAFYLKIKYFDALKNEYTQDMEIFNDREPFAYPPESENLKIRSKKLLSS